MKVMYPYNWKGSRPIEEFPDELLNRHRANSFHGQSLEMLNSRGGLSPSEIIFNLFPLKSIHWFSQNQDSEKHINLLVTIVEMIGPFLESSISRNASDSKEVNK